MKRRLALIFLAAVFALAAWLGPIAAHHLLPLSWTGEAVRLAALIEATEGATLAEIGGGTGAMAREIAQRIGPGGVLFVTELSAERRAHLSAMVRNEAQAQIVVVEADDTGTNLPDACCSALYMRNVLHHVEQRDDSWGGSTYMLAFRRAQ